MPGDYSTVGAERITTNNSDLSHDQEGKLVIGIT